MSRRAAVLIALMLAAGAVVGLAQALGPGDPTTVFASGFTNPCRMAFDASGDLFVADLTVGQIYRVTPDGTRSLFNDDVPDPRGVTFDAFGDLLVTSRTDTAVYKISASGQATKFFDVSGASGITIGPDGSIWIAAVDSVHHFDAMGRYLETIDVTSGGAAAFGVQFSPAGELHMSTFGAMHKLVNGIPVPVATGQPIQMRGFAFDELGNFYWAHRTLDPDSVSRMRLYNSLGAVLEDTFISQLQEPCSSRFARDADGTTTRRMFIAQLDGVIREANSAGFAAPGWPVVGLELAQISEMDAADQIVGATDELDENHASFLDVIGNNDGSYDVGDFRAYLIAAGVLGTTTAVAR
ncbi:MAG: hypothetical protein AMS21_09910 [Gemmatimonas sp. SG8_38_2]|nr:MAG: hypothetical protein AMS21_09910 [Gemmatimonas sp. SG8_38_2]